MGHHPFAIGSAVHRPEYWTVFGDVDRPEPPSPLWCGEGALHRSNILIRQGQLILAPFADEQVFFDLFQIGF
jgi:hypothetical protein